MKIQLAGDLLTASRTDRRLTYRLVPFGEPGRTNKGSVTLTASSLTIPDDVTELPVNIEHDHTRPVGKFAEIRATDEGYEADVDILPTQAGDDLLVEAEAGLRAGISVEVDNPVIRAGKMLAGLLSGAGLVTRPAYPSALLVAADAGELDGDQLDAAELDVQIDGVKYIPAPAEDAPPAAPAAPNQEDSPVTARMTAARAAGQSAPLRAATNPADDLTPRQVFNQLSAAFRSGGQAKVNKLLAALTNVVHDDGDNDGDGLGEITAAPGWLGEVYKRAVYRRKYIPLISSGELTSYREVGFNFGTLPVVGKYTGNKTDVPTGGMTATPIAYNTERWAHAADLDRRYVDFGDSAVLEAFVEAQIESYRKVTDIETLLDILAAGNTFTPGAVPAGIDPTLAAIVDGALTLIGADFDPTFAIVGSDLYRGYALTPKDKIPEYLSSNAGLDEGSLDKLRVVPSAHPSMAGLVVVGDGSTVKFKELGGGTPVRVEAEHIAQGGKDLGVFGYTSFQELVDGGVVKADLAP